MPTGRLLAHIFVGLGCLVAVVPRARALDPSKSLVQYAHRIWGQEEGLFQPTVYSILQARDGLLWLGTQDSLIRFDGMHFRELDESPQAALHQSLVRDLGEDPEGNLWAASVGSGLVRVSPNEQVVHYTTQHGLPSNDVFCLDVRSSQEIWACTNRGLARFDGHSFRTWTTAEGLVSNAIRSTCVATDGQRWVAGLDVGLAHSAGDRFVAYEDRFLSMQSTVTALHCGADGTIWAGSDAGLIRIAKGQASLIDTRAGLPDNTVLSLHEATDGTVWIGTNTGVTRWRNGALSVYRTSDGLSHSSVLSLLQDREGSLWVGTKNGMDQFTDSKLTSYTKRQGLSSDDIGPVLQDKSGRLWIGTLHSGLNVGDHGRFHLLNTAGGLVSNAILSLEQEPSGKIWIGTAAGLQSWQDGRFTATYDRRSGLSSNVIHTILFDSAGTLWVGTDRGLDRWNGSHFQSANPLFPGGNGPPDAGPVLAMSEGRIANLMVSTDSDGLYALRNGQMSHAGTDLSRPADCFFVDRERGETWAGTLGSGLLRYRNGTMAHVRVKDGLYDNRIYGIVRDNSSNFWFASSKGIFRVSQQQLDDFADGRIPAVASLPFTTGQLRFECQSGVQPAVTRTRDGHLWFSTNNGLVTVDPDHLTTNHLPPPTRVTAILINGRRVPVAAGQEITLEPRERNLEIRYAGLSFVSPERVTFRYFLKGYDKTSTDAGTRREAFYTNLPSGPFEFQVSARNADGIASTQAAVFHFYVRPLLYQRVWFFPALTVLLGSFAVLAYRLRVARLRNRFQLVLAERTRIARELHDTLLQGLSGITMQLQALWSGMPSSPQKQILASIITDAGQCSREARRSLWGLRNFGSEPADFPTKLTKLANEAVGDDCLLNLHLQPVSLAARPEAEYQLLRIVAEAISNSLQHGEARSITVTLHRVGAALRLTVHDDGKGFDPRAPSSFGHYGLIGMHERADEIGADLTVTSQPGQGTTVLLLLPTASPAAADEFSPDPAVVHHKK